MKIKRIWEIFREICYLRSLLKKYGNALLPGRYLLLPGMRAIVHDDEVSRANALTYFSWNKGRKFSRLINFLNKKSCFFNKLKNSSGEYEAIYTANNYDKIREVKLFSFVKKKILTVCVSENEREKALRLYSSFHKAYPMPPVVRSSEYPNCYEIAMISLSAPPCQLDALASIAESVAAASPCEEVLQRKLLIEITDLPFEGKMKQLLSPLVDSLTMVEIDALPVCPQHGDLSIANLLFGDCEGRKAFYWIDWEHLGNRTFFYDYFFYIFVTAVGGEDSFLRRYISGECDSHLIPFFRHFGVEYDAQKRDKYLLMFALEFLKERVCSRGYIAALERYCAFLETHGFIKINEGLEKAMGKQSFNHCSKGGVS